jgi:NAD(P)-dependent dehydrogenase (short-subunit alcohol dehydrogenase family)
MDISGKIAIITGAASGIGLGVATVLAEAGANVHGQTVNVAEQQSAELWPLLWPLEATLDALCTLGAQAIRGVKRLLFVSFSHFLGKQKKSWNRLTKSLLYR